ncbi:MAG: YciI family protein [Planctomycetes bacterium]|nr:YciI family protein [Planctomycetota bacterium]
MRYLLLCYSDEKIWEEAGEEAHRQAIDEAIEVLHDIDARGQYVLAAALESTTTSTSIRVREGERMVTDGPFAETRESLGGFYLIDVPDLETAIEIAERHPGARVGTVEIRPLRELDNLPDPSGSR